MASIGAELYPGRLCNVSLCRVVIIDAFVSIGQHERNLRIKRFSIVKIRCLSVIFQMQEAGIVS
jgi:hypothetical protein